MCIIHIFINPLVFPKTLKITHKLITTPVLSVSFADRSGCSRLRPRLRQGSGQGFHACLVRTTTTPLPVCSVFHLLHRLYAFRVYLGPINSSVVGLRVFHPYSERFGTTVSVNSIAQFISLVGSISQEPLQQQVLRDHVLPPPPLRRRGRCPG